MSATALSTPEMKLRKGEWEELLLHVHQLGVYTSENYKGRNISRLKFLIDELSPSAPFLPRILDECYRAFEELFKNLKIRSEPMLTQLQVRSLFIGQPQLHPRVVPPEDAKDLLSTLKSNKLICASSQLSNAESQLLITLFREIPLDSKMFLLDFLCFGMVLRLEDLKKDISLPLQEAVALTQHQIAATSIKNALGDTIEFIALANIRKPLAPKTTYLVERSDTLISTLQRHINTLKAQVSATRPVSSRATKAQKEAVEKNKKRILKNIDDHILPICNLLSTFLALKIHPGEMVKRLPILQIQLIMLSGSNLIDETPSDPEIVKKYWQFIHNGYQHLSNNKETSLEMNFKQRMGDMWKLSSHPSVEEMNAFLKKIMDESVGWTMTLADMVNRQLCSKPSAISDIETSLETIRECMAHFCKRFLADIHRLSEFRMFPHGTMTTDSRFHRLMYNIKKYQAQKPQLDKSNLLIDKALNQIENGLKTSDIGFDWATEIDDTYNGLFEYGTWIIHLRPQQGHIENMFATSMALLTQLKIDLLQEYDDKWSQMTYQEIQNLDLEKVQETLMQDALPLVRPILILSDLLALLQIRRFSEEAEVIPPPLADVMQMDELSDLIARHKKAKEPKPVEKQPMIPAAAAAQPELKIKTKKIPKEADPKVVSPPPPALTVSDAHILRSLTKSREILTWLYQNGFMEARTTGSHHILHSSSGAQVVVPNNNSLPKGTRNSIAKQVENAKK